MTTSLVFNISNCSLHLSLRWHSPTFNPSGYFLGQVILAPQIARISPQDLNPCICHLPQGWRKLSCLPQHQSFTSLTPAPSEGVECLLIQTAKARVLIAGITRSILINIRYTCLVWNVTGAVTICVPQGWSKLAVNAGSDLAIKLQICVFLYLLDGCAAHVWQKHVCSTMLFLYTYTPFCLSVQLLHQGRTTRTASVHLKNQ